jgi:hypothetical protein
LGLFVQGVISDNPSVDDIGGIEVWVEGGMVAFLEPSCDFITERRASDVTDYMRSDEVKGDVAVAVELEIGRLGCGQRHPVRRVVILAIWIYSTNPAALAEIVPRI